MREFGVGLGLSLSLTAIVVALATNNVWWNVAAIAAAMVGSFIAGRAVE